MVNVGVRMDDDDIQHHALVDVLGTFGVTVAEKKRRNYEVVDST